MTTQTQTNGQTSTPTTPAAAAHAVASEAQPSEKRRSAGVYVIIAKNAEGKIVYGERPDKRSAVAAVQAAGADNVLKVYKGAREVVLSKRVKETITLG